MTERIKLLVKETPKKEKAWKFQEKIKEKIDKTYEKEINDKLRLLRNHGMKNRDEIEILGYNSRLDTIQAVVGNWLIPKTKEISDLRIKNAAYYDKNFSKIKQFFFIGNETLSSDCFLRKSKD